MSISYSIRPASISDVRNIYLLIRENTDNLVPRSINDIVQMACVNPNTLLGETKRGQLKVGNYADLCIFNKELQPEWVFVGGKVQKAGKGAQ